MVLYISGGTGSGLVGGLHELDGVLEEVVVEVLVDVEEEVEGDLLGVEDLLDPDGELVDVPVLVLALDDGGGVEAGDVVLGLVGALPLVPGDDGLGLVVDVVDGGGLDLAVLEEEGAEHGDGPEVEVVDEVVVVLLFEEEPGLPDGPRVDVDDEVVVDDALLVEGLVLGLVGDGDHAEVVPPGLPEVGDGHLDLAEAVGLPDRVLDVVGAEAALGVVPQVEALDLDLLVVAGPEPDYHRVVVGLPRQVLVGPLVVLGLVPGHCLRVGSQGPIVVGQHEPVVVVLPRLPHADRPTLVEYVQVHQVRLLPQEHVLRVAELVGVEVEEGEPALAGLGNQEVAG